MICGGELRYSQIGVQSADLAINSTYMNATSVTAQVNDIKSRPNMLLWYTADEPDGTSDPLSATADSYDLITSLDGGPSSSAAKTGGTGYHPISLVLNCENFEFTAYTSGADIVMQVWTP